ncbi:MAG: hypothetical protein FWC22_08500 [Treponema sp.]|nr:hypothetical protein [Treponema sp.]
MAKFLLNAPFTEEGAKLELTAEMEENCKSVYKLDDEGGAAFAGFWNPEAEYTDEFVILPVRSSFDIVDELAIGTCFANVIGSKCDPKILIPGTEWEYSWIKLYEVKTECKLADWKACCTDGKIYAPNDSEITTTVSFPTEKEGEYEEVTPFCCGCSSHSYIELYHFGIVGGHIIKSKIAGRVTPGVDFVYILPICQRHNICNLPDTYNWGAGYYMKLKKNTPAVKLKGYLQSPTLQLMLKDAANNV